MSRKQLSGVNFIINDWFTQIKQVNYRRINYKSLNTITTEEKHKLEAIEFTLNMPCTEAGWCLSVK
jgi:hypothetical protein